MQSIKCSREVGGSGIDDVIEHVCAILEKTVINWLEWNCNQVGTKRESHLNYFNQFICRINANNGKNSFKTLRNISHQVPVIRNYTGECYRSLSAKWNSIELFQVSVRRECVGKVGE